MTLTMGLKMCRSNNIKMEMKHHQVFPILSKWVTVLVGRWVGDSDNGEPGCPGCLVALVAMVSLVALYPHQLGCPPPTQTKPSGLKRSKLVSPLIEEATASQLTASEGSLNQFQPVLKSWAAVKCKNASQCIIFSKYYWLLCQIMVSITYQTSHIYTLIYLGFPLVCAACWLSTALASDTLHSHLSAGCLPELAKYVLS